MKDILEIIVTLEGESKPRQVPFESLYPLKDSIQSIMFLWNANSYYVDRVNNTFMINGGRRFTFPRLGNSVIEYRRRSTVQVSTTGSHESKRTFAWLIGLKGDNDELLLLEINQFGTAWSWKNTL